MTETNISSIQNQQEKYRVIINVQRRDHSAPAVRLETGCLSEAIQEAWHLIHQRNIPASMVDILSLNPVGLWCSIWDETC